MIHILHAKATAPQLAEMFKEYGSMTKVVRILTQSEDLRKQVESVTREILGGVS